MMSEFYTTRNSFREFTGYSNPLSFDEWDALPEDQKAAVLYLQFFDQITLAWYKNYKSWAVEADGVSEVLQYLNKNVKIIHENPKRFTPNYIYKVAWNCLNCVCWDETRRGRAYKNECSNIVGYGDDELDLFETIIDNEDIISKQRKAITRDKFWEIIEDMGKDTVTVVNELLGYKIPKRDVVDEATKPEIIENLRKALKPFSDMDIFEY